MERHRGQPRRPRAARRLRGDAAQRAPAAVLIVGLSDTGKTTTTFTTSWAASQLRTTLSRSCRTAGCTTENGCFAKTSGLDPDFEPAICNAAVKPDAYLENVSVDANGKVDFFDTSYTKNGRTAWPLSYVDPWPGNDVPPVEFMPSLSKNENIVPAVARLDREQAASTLTRSPGWMTPSPGRSAEIARTAPAALGTRRGGAAPGSAMLTIRYE